VGGGERGAHGCPSGQGAAAVDHHVQAAVRPQLHLLGGGPAGDVGEHQHLELEAQLGLDDGLLGRTRCGGDRPRGLPPCRPRPGGVGFGLEARVDAERRALAHRAVSPARPLLHHVRQLVTDQLPAGRAAGVVLTLPEEDVLAAGEGPGPERAVEGGGPGVGVDPDPAEVRSEGPFHGAPERLRQGSSGARARRHHPLDVPVAELALQLQQRMTRFPQSSRGLPLRFRRR
jgi:hypothetical protein